MQSLTVRARFTGRILMMLALLIAPTCLSQAKGTDSVQVRALGGDRVVLENSWVRVEYDLAAGIYQAWDQQANELVIEKAQGQVNGLSSAEPGLTRVWTEGATRDALGRGRTLTVTSTRPGQPALIQEFTLYEGKTFLALGGGVGNTTDQPLRVMEIHALAGARAFADGEIRDLKVLNGEAGGGETKITTQTTVYTPNNLLFTFRQGNQSKSLVMGGLTYHDFAKYVSAGAQQTRQKRRRQIEQLGLGGTVASYLDCGKTDHDEAPGQPSLTLVKGQPYEFSAPADLALACYRTVSFDPREVVFQVAGLDPARHYLVGFSWWDYDNNGRQQQVCVGSGENTPTQVVLDTQPLPRWLGDQSMPHIRTVVLPAAAIATGKARVSFRIPEGLPGNAVVSEVWLSEAGAGEAVKEVGEPIVVTVEPAPEIAPVRLADLDLYAEDPVGKRVDAGSRYLPDDRFYIDFVTGNPFAALEQYGRVVAAATGARPNPYYYPEVCAWYIGMPIFGGDKWVNDTTSMVAEMDAAKNSGFTRYCPVAMRLVPDTYLEQGWWDDAHWRQYGHYTAPYETSQKWGKAITERGGIPTTYFQTGFYSADYARAFPEHMLFNGQGETEENLAKDSQPYTFENTYDYTDPSFRKHVSESWANLRQAGFKGVMFDYPETGWHVRGGFEDPYATAASAYRAVFELAKEGLGPDSWVHERNVWNQPFLDMPAGVVDSQRTEVDTDLGTAAMYNRCALRWYKTRVLYAYDTDAKNLNKVTPANRDGLRQMLSMVYITTGRMLLATSFRKMTPEQLYDLERLFPMHQTPLGARPLDLFAGKPFPQIYDFPISPDWHQTAFYNTDTSHSALIGVALGQSTAEGGMGLEPGRRYYAYDFWNDRFLGTFNGAGRLEQKLRPGEVRMMAIHAVADHPQFLSTNRHLLQGYLELRDIKWYGLEKKLSGTAQVVGGEPFKLVLATNGYAVKSCAAKGALARIESVDAARGLTVLSLDSPTNQLVPWTVLFGR